MKLSDIKIAELALVVTLYRSIPKQKPGRLKNLLEMLSAVAEKEADKLPKASKEAGIAFDKFGKMTGWSEKDKHLQTYVNSILLIIENRKYTKINKILMEILDYQERQKKIHPSCFWSAEVVQKKWVECFKDC